MDSLPASVLGLAPQHYCSATKDISIFLFYSPSSSLLLYLKRHDSGGANYQKLASKKLLHNAFSPGGHFVLLSILSVTLFPSFCRLNFSKVHRLAVTTHWSCFPLRRLLYGVVTDHWWFSWKSSPIVCPLFVASLRKWVLNTEINAALKHIFQALKIRDCFKFEHTAFHRHPSVITRD